MKRSILLALIFSLTIFASCDPVKITTPNNAVTRTADALSKSFSCTQYADPACTTPQADGNYIKYTTNPATEVQIIQVKADGSEKILGHGASGVFPLIPRRGENPTQSVFLRAFNPDGTYTDGEVSLVVYVPQDLDPEMKLMVSDDGKKDWMWNFTAAGGTCWGNGGQTGSGASFTYNTVDGHWWGVETPEGLLDQLQHSGGVVTGAESSTAYMTFSEEGDVTSFTPSGKQIYKAPFEIKSYDPQRSSGWQIATLTTGGNKGILWPFSINENGKVAPDFDVMYLDANYMTLVYTKGNGAGSWGEITHWMFKNKSFKPALFGVDKRKWGWAAADAPVWGNAGHSGNGAGYTPGVVDGQWWGATPEELKGQLQHSETHAETGEEDFGAYMIFTADGDVATYKPDGSKIRGGSFEVDLYEKGRKDGWELGKLKTTVPALLFPFSINEGGVGVTEFDIMYFDADNITLVYTKGNAAGSWGEITWWKFAPKNE